MFPLKYFSSYKKSIYSPLLVLPDIKIVDKIAYNYNKNESRTTSFSAKELQDYIIEKKLGKISIITGDKSTLTTTITEIQKGKEFWKIALILSLLFFATEILLIKLIKS